MLLAAAGVPRFFPAASPRRVVEAGFVAVVLGLVVLVGAMDVGAGAEIVTGPLLLIGLGMGGLASQLGSVTVSAVPDAQSPEVGGLQNTATQFGASLGTALAGSVLITALTASFLSGIAQNPAVPAPVSQQATVQLARRHPLRLRRPARGGAAGGGGRPGDGRGRAGGERAGAPGRAARGPRPPRRARRARALLHAPDPAAAARRAGDDRRSRIQVREAQTSLRAIRDGENGERLEQVGCP